MPTLDGSPVSPLVPQERRAQATSVARRPCAAPAQASAPLARALSALRDKVPPLGEDRALASEIETAATLVADGRLVASTGVAMPDLAQ